MSITVDSQDVSDAEEFIVSFLSDRIDDGDYTEGALLRDLSVKAISYVFAYLRKTDAQIRVRQSLLTVEETDTSDDEEAADDAIDAILSNWLISRNQGKFVYLLAYGFSTERVDMNIPAETTFYKTASLAFLLNNEGDDLHVPAEDLIAQFDSTGEITGYTFRIPLVSQDPGDDFNIEPGRFVSFDQFSPYVTHVETLEKASGGDDIETSTDFIDRSKTVVTIRNLINARSVDAVLRDTFEDLNQVSTVGMGDTEMIRDRVVEQATGLTLHVGGHQDMFLDLSTVETSFVGVVGARFERPDGVISVFRDETYADYDADTNPGGHKFTDPDPITGKTILPGMALRIWVGLPISARDFIIREVRDTEIHVSERVPFPTATDTAGTYVSWSVGSEMPNYRDVVGTGTPDNFITTGETSKQVQNPGRVVLPGGPVYRIKDVTIADRSDPDANPDDGLVHFTTRVNVAPTSQVAPDNEYQVTVHNPEAHQSEISFAELIVGPDTDLDKYDGKTIKVTYDTLAGFAPISDKVRNRQDRISGANPLARGFHPAYLRFALEYNLRRDAEETVDEEEATQNLVTFINTYPATEVLDVSTIIGAFRENYPQVGRVFPFTVEYDLHVPDGRVVQFETTEDIIVPRDVSKLRTLLVDPDTESESLLDPVEYGIGDDVIRYFTAVDDITVQERAE
jgi:hypothetical protein